MVVFGARCRSRWGLASVVMVWCHGNECLYRGSKSRCSRMLCDRVGSWLRSGNFCLLEAVNVRVKGIVA